MVRPPRPGTSPGRFSCPMGRPDHPNPLLQYPCAVRDQSALTVWSQYLALRAIAGFTHCFDIDQNLTAAAQVGSLFYRLSNRHRQRAIRNIAESFPDWPAQRVAQTARRSIQNMFQIFMVDAIAMPRRVTESSWPHYLRIGNLRGLMDRLLRGEPTICITGHCGN